MGPYFIVADKVLGRVLMLLKAVKIGFRMLVLSIHEKGYNREQQDNYRIGLHLYNPVDIFFWFLYMRTRARGRNQRDCR